MREARVTRIFVAATLACMATSAAAHDPDWKPDTEKTEKGEAQGEGALPPASVDESEPWPDPFAEERKWKAVVGAGAGYFVPWQGDGGHASTAHLLAESPGGHVRVGGEFLYRSYETRIFDVSGVDTDTYEVSFLFHYLFNPGGLTPYVGFDTGLQVNKIRKTEVQASSAVRVTDDIGVGWGLAAIAGVELPLGDHFALYGEARAGIALQETDGGDTRGRRHDHDREDEDLGGATGILGVRYRF